MWPSTRTELCPTPSSFIGVRSGKTWVSSSWTCGKSWSPTPPSLWRSLSVYSTHILCISLYLSIACYLLLLTFDSWCCNIANPPPPILGLYLRTAAVLLNDTSKVELCVCEVDFKSWMQSYGFPEKLYFIYIYMFSYFLFYTRSGKRTCWKISCPSQDPWEWPTSWSLARPPAVSTWWDPIILGDSDPPPPC